MPIIHFFRSRIYVNYEHEFCMVVRSHNYWGSAGCWTGLVDLGDLEGRGLGRSRLGFSSSDVGSVKTCWVGIWCCLLTEGIIEIGKKILGGLESWGKGWLGSYSSLTDGRFDYRLRTERERKRAWRCTSRGDSLMWDSLPSFPSYYKLCSNLKTQALSHLFFDNGSSSLPLLSYEVMLQKSWAGVLL